MIKMLDFWLSAENSTKSTFYLSSPVFQRSHQSSQVVRGQDNGSGTARAHPGGVEGTDTPVIADNVIKQSCCVVMPNLIAFLYTDSNWR